MMRFMSAPCRLRLEIFPSPNHLRFFSDFIPLIKVSYSKFKFSWPELKINNDYTAQRSLNPIPSAATRARIKARLVDRLPVFKDMLEGFELQLRLEIYRPEQWATMVKGHLSSRHVNPVSHAGGHLNIYRITDEDLKASDDGMLMVVPWRQIGREFNLYSHGWPPGPRIMTHVNHIRGGIFRFTWRGYQTPRGREYY